MPNILYIMTDQQRADTIAALGNSLIRTPNLDRLVRRGAAFTQAYSSCPVCVPARYTVRTGCEPYTTGFYSNGRPVPVTGQAATVEGRCGPYLARRLNQLGYRTFGIGKFHTMPHDEDLGYEVHLHTEELWGSPQMRTWDSYAGFIQREHPEFAFVEQLHGERTEMYYMPQTSPLPAELTVEGWVADRAVEQLWASDARPYFGFISFIGPHPPFAPPIPYNRMYGPDCMPDPIRGVPEVDAMDEQITWMNHAIWADGIGDARARVLKARYFGEISYIDACLGRILDAVEARPDADDTLICFFSDHGDHLGDHSAWQKESFFDAACRVPFLVSWPRRLAGSARCNDLVCLTDLFGIATSAAGCPELRDGCDVLGVLEGRAAPREHLFGFYGEPGTPLFKIMARQGPWKYIYLANGSREQLFNVDEDPFEVRQLLTDQPDVAAHLRAVATAEVAAHAGTRPALAGSVLAGFPFAARPAERIYQLDTSQGIRRHTLGC